MTSAHDGVEFVGGDPHRQVVADDAAAHAALQQKREAAEHLAFGDVSPAFERVSNSLSELFVVRHGELTLILMQSFHPQ